MHSMLLISIKNKKATYERHFATPLLPTYMVAQLLMCLLVILSSCGSVSSALGGSGKATKPCRMSRLGLAFAAGGYKMSCVRNSSTTTY